MDIDFHYYATYVAALLGNFSHDEALIIAISAQLVDDFTAKNFPSKCFKKPLAEQIHYTCYDFSNFDYLKQGWAKDAELAKIWACFHFLPCWNTEGMRYIDYAKEELSANLLNFLCFPNGQIYKGILCRWTSKEKNPTLFDLGVSAHVLADTFAHWGFVGFKYKNINNISSTPIMKNNGSEGIPISAIRSIGAIGHCPLGHHPDIAREEITYTPNWIDPKKCETITRNNQKDFFEAFEMMVDLFTAANKNPSPVEGVKNGKLDIKSSVREILSSTDTAKNELTSISEWETLCRNITGIEIPKYTVPATWLDEYTTSLPSTSKLEKFVEAANRHFYLVNSYVQFSNPNNYKQQ